MSFHAISISIARASCRRLAREDGTVLAMALMTMALLSAAGLGLVLATMTEVSVAANYAASRLTLFGAEAALERAFDDLAGMPDWNPVLAGLALSTFADGSPGVRELADGTSIDLRVLTNMANCGKSSVCSVAEASVVTAERPWGANNPYWQLFAFAPLRDLLPAGRVDSNLYVLAWVADDAAESDGNPFVDGTTGTPGAGVLVIRAEAFGAGGAHESLEAAIMRPSRPPQLARALGWQQRPR